MTFRIIMAAAITLAGTAAVAQDGGMSFFVTSENPGQGGNFGQCTTLADNASVGGKTWKAYLSTSAENARDRIGAGPWVNARGESIALSVDELHSDANNLTKDTALNEMGEPVNGRGDTPNRHDILTGSTPEGTYAEGMTCADWTSNAEDAAGMVGHHDRLGLDDTPPSKSWNSSHSSRGGCGLEALRGTGGDGLLYCFAL